MSRTRRRDPDRRSAAAGFTLIELIVVVGLIAAMVGVAVPSVAAFIRSYSISGAAKDIASEMNRARYRAIMKNVNTGVLFVVLDEAARAGCGVPARCYMWAIEDDQDPQTAPDTETLGLDLLLAEPAQVGIVKTLPVGVEFVGGGTDPAWRYDRYGGWCNPDPMDNDCRDVAGFSGASYVVNNVNGGTISITQPSTQLGRTLTIGTGGRVIIENY